MFLLLVLLLTFLLQNRQDRHSRGGFPSGADCSFCDNSRMSLHYVLFAWIFCAFVQSLCDFQILYYKTDATD